MKPCRYCAEEIQDAALLCRFCNREQVRQPPPSSRPDHTVLNAVLALLMVLVLGAGGYLLGQNTLPLDESADVAGASLVPGRSAAPAVEEKKPAPRPMPPPPPPPSRFTMMGERTMNLDGGQYVAYGFDLREWGCSVRGSVSVTAGGSHDVDVFFVDEAGYAAFKASEAFQPYFSRQRTITADIDLPRLAPGQYYLIVSNRFSWMTGKTVQFGGMAAECQVPPDPSVEFGGGDV